MWETGFLLGTPVPQDTHTPSCRGGQWSCVSWSRRRTRPGSWSRRDKTGGFGRKPWIKEGRVASWGTFFSYEPGKRNKLQESLRAEFFLGCLSALCCAVPRGPFSPAPPPGPLNSPAPYGPVIPHPSWDSSSLTQDTFSTSDTFTTLPYLVKVCASWKSQNNFCLSETFPDSFLGFVYSSIMILQKLYCSLFTSNLPL